VFSSKSLQQIQQWLVTRLLELAGYLHFLQERAHGEPMAEIICTTTQIPAAPAR